MEQLTDTQINTFHQKGWIGPLDTFSASEVEYVRKEVEAISQIKQLDGHEQNFRIFYNSHFDCKTVYHHHLWCRSLSNLFEDKRVINRLNQLDQENLLFWRTAIFHRMPKEEGLRWHQAIEYYGKNIDSPKSELVFPFGEEILNLTVWIALTDITPEMGGICFANGTHKKRFNGFKFNVPEEIGIYKHEKYYSSIQAKPGDSMYSSDFNYNFNENEWEIESVSAVKAGQIVIFSERIMHKALANYSTKERWAINGRYIPPSVQIYPQRLTEDYMDDFNFDTRKHFCILVSGRDDYGINNVHDSYHASNNGNPISKVNEKE